MDRPGVLAEVAGVISNLGVNISHVAVFRNGGTSVNLVVRIDTLDSTPVVTELERNGYHVTAVHRNWVGINS